MATEFSADTERTGIAKWLTPNHRPGHTNLSAQERLRLEYLTGQPAQEDQDQSVKPEPGLVMRGNAALPKNLKKPKYAPQRVGGYVTEDTEGAK